MSLSSKLKSILKLFYFIFLNEDVISDIFFLKKLELNN